MRQRADPRAGSTAGRDGREPHRVQPGRQLRRSATRPKHAATSCCRTCTSSTTSTTATYEDGIQRATADRQPQIQQPAAAADRGPLLHQLGRPQIVTALQNEGLSPKQAQYEAYYGGLKIKLSIDLSMQHAAQDGDRRGVPGHETGNPTASLVAIDNRTGEVRAMVSGDGDYQQSPFNLATLGLPPARVLVQDLHARGGALQRRVRPVLRVRLQADHDPVRQEGRQRLRTRLTAPAASPCTTSATTTAASIPMTLATATSDNSVFAQLGMTERRHREDRALRAADGDPLADLDQPVDDPRRPQARRLGARHGARLLDGRQRRQEGLQPDPRRHGQAARSGSTRSQGCGCQCRHEHDHQRETLRDPAGDHPRGRQRRSTSCCTARSTTATAPAPPPRSPGSMSPARPARPPTTSTPGSSAGPRR